MSDGGRDVIHCGNCLEWLRSQPDSSVDLVFGSPPYEDARTYGIGFKLKGQDWVDWMLPVVVESVRVTRGLAAFVLEGRTKNYRWTATPALLMADLHRAGVNLRKPPIFKRVGIPGSGGPDWLRNDYEFIVCATQPGKLVWSDNTAMGHHPKWAPGGAMSNRNQDGYRDRWGSTGNRTGMQGRKPSGEHKRRNTKRDADGLMRSQCYGAPAIANPGNVIECVVGGGVMGSKMAHENEAPFPERLPEFFVRSFCPPGGIVVDPFSGSGTTAAVARRLGRHFVAIDLRQSQCDLTRRRVSEFQRFSGS